MSNKRPRKTRRRLSRPISAAPNPAPTDAARVQLRARNTRLRRMSIFLAVLLVVAVGLRVTNLTGQSLWADEGNSVRVTERSLALVVAAARGDHRHAARPTSEGFFERFLIDDHGLVPTL